MEKNNGITMIVVGLILTLIGIWPIGIPLIFAGPISLVLDIKTNYFTQKESKKEASKKFYSINADLQQHLKDDGFIEPKPGSEEHFQRWKAERKKQTREP